MKVMSRDDHNEIFIFISSQINNKKLEISKTVNDSDYEEANPNHF